MSGINSVRGLIGVLSEDEKDTVRQYLKMFNQRGDKLSNKSLMLFELLNSSEDPLLSDREIEYQCYGKSNPDAFAKLLVRLRDKILDCLLLEVNVKREGVFSPRTKAMFEIKRKTAAGQILRARGQRDTAFFLFDAAIDLARRYELYDELLIPLRLKIKQVSLDKGRKDLAKLVSQYNHYDYCCNAIVNAELVYSDLISGVDFTSNEKIGAAWLESKIKELTRDYKVTGSDELRHYLYYVEIHFQQEKGQHAKAGKLLGKLLDLIVDHESLYTKPRHAGILILQAENDLHLLRFTKTRQLCTEALRLLRDESFNAQQCREIQFYASFYTGRYNEAAALIEKLLDQSGNLLSDFRTGKRRYLKACTLFMQGKFHEALSIVSETNEIKNDAAGWNIGIRLLHILCLIELEELDDAVRKIDNLRKYTRHNEKGPIGSKRVYLICQLLGTLERRSFDFKSLYTEQQALVDQLRFIHTSETRWQVKSFELIPFQDWLFAKAFRQPLQLRFSPEKELSAQPSQKEQP